MLDLVEGLRRDRFAPLVVMPNDGPYFAQCRALGVRVLDLSVRGFQPATLAAMIRAIRQERVALVHSHGKGAGLYGRIAAALTRTPVVHSFQGLHYRHHGRLVRRTYLGLERLLARLTTRFIHVSRSEMEEALALGVSNASRAVVIPNAVDCGQIDRLGAAPDGERAALGVADTSPIVGCVARISPQKGLDDFVRAMRLVADAMPSARFVLVGDAPAGDEALKRQLSDLVVSLGMADRLVRTGYRSDAVRLMKTFDVYVSSALWEGLPIALLEAMACRRPIVATDVGGNNDVVVHGTTGFLVPVGSPWALADRVNTLLADPALRREFGDAGRQRVEELFSIRATVAATSDLYEHMLVRRVSG